MEKELQTHCTGISSGVFEMGNKTKNKHKFKYIVAVAEQCTALKKMKQVGKITSGEREVSW